MKIAVTSAGGQLGSAIIKALVREKEKDNVVGIARSPKKVEHPGIEIRKGDYNSYEDFLKALKGIEVVLLVSGFDTPENRILQHRNIIRAAKDSGVRKIVYTSIYGAEGKTTFDPIVRSNRQTEKDIRESGLDWSIGRNGLYIEPDVEYIKNYIKEGHIANCAGEGLCSYTSREELAHAYVQMILYDDRNFLTFNLAGEAISQSKLTNYLNKSFGTSLVYKDMSPEAYLAFQKEHNGNYLGSIIAGIYTKIRRGEFALPSDYTRAAGREHLNWDAYFSSLKTS